MKRSTPGRPPLSDDDPSVRVGVSLPSKQFDRFSQRALREGISVPAVIRRDLNLQQKKSTK